jgi:NADH dehydrogenase
MDITVTGAFSFTGKYIAKELLKKNVSVRTLTRKNGNSLIQAKQHDYENVGSLVKALEGSQALINTYWRRMPHPVEGYEDIIRHSRNLFDAAKIAGIERIIHVSITNPEGSRFPYFKAKETVEYAAWDSGISCAIIRPQLNFGTGELLINNLAWFIRRFPIAPIPGDGKYLLQPLHIEDMAKLATQLIDSNEEKVIDAVGPEVFDYNTFVKIIGKAVGKDPILLHVSPDMFINSAKLLDKFFAEPTLTDYEVHGCLIDNTFKKKQCPQGSLTLGDWLQENCNLGKIYVDQDHRYDR